jgi:hypothetical protein
MPRLSGDSPTDWGEGQPVSEPAIHWGEISSELGALPDEDWGEGQPVSLHLIPSSEDWGSSAEFAALADENWGEGEKVNIYVIASLCRSEEEPAHPDTSAFVRMEFVERGDALLGPSPRVLDLSEGLVADHSYEIRIDISAIRDAHQEGDPVEPPLHKESGDETALRVAIVSNNPLLHFSNQVSKLIWGPGFSSRPAVFLLHAYSPGRVGFDLFIDCDCDLLFAARVTVEITSELGGWTSPVPITWMDATAERQIADRRSVAFRRFAALRQRRSMPRALCIVVARGTQSDEYVLTLLTGDAELPMRVKFSRPGLDALLRTIRSTLDLQRRGRVLLNGGYGADGIYAGDYERGADCRRTNGTLIPELLISESWNGFLSRMAIHGRALRDILFADEGALEVLHAIHAAAQDGSVVQVWTRHDAKEFLFAWAWIYDDDYRPGTRELPRPEAFWGQRYIIEQMVELPQLLPKVLPEIARSAGRGFNIHVGVYNFEQLPLHVRFLESLAGPKSHGDNLTNVNVHITDNVVELLEYLQRGDSDLLYFFCHGHSARPPGIASEAFHDMVEELERWLDQPNTVENSSDQFDRNEELETLDAVRLRLRAALHHLRDTGLLDHDHMRLKIGHLMLADLRKLTPRDGHAPLVIMNMCESAQIFPSLSDGLVSVFLARGAIGVVGTEMPMLPQFADLFGRRLLTRLLQGESIGSAMLALRQEFMRKRNPLGLGYIHFGDAWARLFPAQG